MEQERESIIIAAAVEGGSISTFKHLLDHLAQRYVITEAQYGAKKQTAWVKFVLKNAVVDAYMSIKNMVAVDLNIDCDEIENWKYKKHRTVVARDLIAFILRHREGYSYSEISKLMGSKSHVTVLLSCRKFNMENLIFHRSNLEIDYVDAKKRYKNKI